MGVKKTILFVILFIILGCSNETRERITKKEELRKEAEEQILEKLGSPIKFDLSLSRSFDFSYKIQEYIESNKDKFFYIKTFMFDIKKLKDESYILLADALPTKFRLSITKEKLQSFNKLSKLSPAYISFYINKIEFPEFAINANSECEEEDENHSASLSLDIDDTSIIYGRLVEVVTS